MVLVGLTAVFWPEGLMELARYAHTSSGLYVAAFGRIALGALLFMAAAATRTPRTVRVIGPLIFVAGLATALISVERAQLLSDWWLGHGPDFLRIAACFPLVVGLFIGGATLAKGRSS